MSAGGDARLDSAAVRIDSASQKLEIVAILNQGSKMVEMNNINRTTG